MGVARNNAIVLSEQAPPGAVGQDVMSVGLYTGLTGGTPLAGMDISTNPDALELGQRYEIAINALELRQPAAGGAQITQVQGNAAAGANTIVVDAVGSLSVNEHFVIGGEAYSISAINAGTRTLTLNETLRAAVANNAVVQVALETHEMTLRKLRGAISGGLFVAYFSSTWANANSGTLNAMALARTSVPEANWNVS